MWQLVLLSQVIPAFGALAKEFEERELPDQSLADDARDCYSDIVSIGHALFVSRGEWNSSLRDDILMGALEALETRLPKGWGSSLFYFASSTSAGEQDDEGKFPRLKDLSESLKSKSLGGFDECLELLSQPGKVRDEYLGLVGRKVCLFHKSERQSWTERQKFVRRVRIAGKHLLDVYCRDTSAADVEEFNLSQHPSHGIKEPANCVYNLLERHWNCRCPQYQLAAKRREARLSLIRYRQLVPKVTTPVATAQSYRPAKFEVLLPVCTDIVQWKVTNVEVKRQMAQSVARVDRHSVNNDICQRLFDSDGFQVDFLAENNSLWHLTPDLLDGAANHYTIMESLNQLLGDGVAISDVAKYTPREKLTLCYILADSMLFLYPGSWIQSTWSSTKVYFVRRVHGSSQSPVPSSVLTFPYLSVELQQARQQKSPKHHMQYHSHPAILALGIIFLEIATGARFNRSHETEQWRAFNNDGLQALESLRNLEKKSERDRSKRISPALDKAIRSCLRLNPPSTFPSQSLAQEGPIRQYILSCIVQPLALELRDGYKVRLEELDEVLVPEKAVESNNETTGQQRRGSAVGRRLSEATVDSPIAKIEEKVETTFEERREICLFADGRDTDGEARVEQDKVSMTERWFEYHKDATSRIRNELRSSVLSGAQRVKIAILDSGIELSDTQKAQYGFDSGVEYRSFVDPEDANTQWKDEVGHGTHLAVLLRKMAENAVICVARVFKKKPHVVKSAESIARALRYALDEWDVDIVVMSFGFGKENDTLSKAIDYAASKKVLLFAAASNDGKNRPDGAAWPASRTDVFCVHAADGYGNPSPFTPSAQDNMRLMTLGECVRSAWPPFPQGSKRKMPDDRRLMSGTSCAAPIAAGIAAIVLDYARGFLDEQKWRRLRRYDPIRRMFDHLKDKNNTTGYWWIKYWTLFDPKWEAPWIENTIRGFIES